MKRGHQTGFTRFFKIDRTVLLILNNLVNPVCDCFDRPTRHGYYDGAVSYRFPWHRLSDEQLLDLRICDLPIKIKGSFLEPHIKRLYSELNSRGIRFKPHVWLAEEWFSPDRVSGIAIPFYLAHPRLMKLERKQMLEIEGGTDKECMSI